MAGRSVGGWVDARPLSGDDQRMVERWPSFHSPALRWCVEIERAVQRLGHPEQGAFIAILNALEYQFEQGAAPPTVRHMIAALLSFCTATGINSQSIKLESDIEALMASIAPRSKHPRKRSR